MSPFIPRPILGGRPIRPVGPEPRYGVPLAGPMRPAAPTVSPLPARGLPSYRKGGIVKKTGPAMLHKGERVLSVKQVAAAKARKQNPLAKDIRKGVLTPAVSKAWMLAKQKGKR